MRLSAVANDPVPPAAVADDPEEEDSAAVADDHRASSRSRGRPSRAEVNGAGRRDRSLSEGVQSEVSTIVGDSASEAGQEVRGEPRPKAPNHGDDTPQSRSHAARNEEKEVGNMSLHTVN